MQTTKSIFEWNQMTDDRNLFDLGFLWGEKSIEFFKLNKFLTGTTVHNTQADKIVYEEVFALHET